MSESREHKRRYNLRLEFIAEISKWLDREPPMILFWKWRKWKNERPTSVYFLYAYEKGAWKKITKARSPITFEGRVKLL